MGKSVFLDSIDGSFSIKVQQVSQALTTQAFPTSEVEPQNSESDGCPDADDSSFMLSETNISVLLNILKSYDSVQTLQYTGKEIEDNGVCIVFVFSLLKFSNVPHLADVADLLH